MATRTDTATALIRAARNLQAAEQLCCCDRTEARYMIAEAIAGDEALLGELFARLHEPEHRERALTALWNDGYEFGKAAVEAYEPPAVDDAGEAA